MEQNAFIKKLKLQSGDLKSALKHKVWQFMKRYDWIQASVSTSLDLTREIEQETSHPSVLSLSVLKYLCGSKSCLLGDEGDLADAVTEGWRARSWREGVCVCVVGRVTSLGFPWQCNKVPTSLWFHTCTCHVDYSQSYNVQAWNWLMFKSTERNV